MLIPSRSSTKRGKPDGYSRCTPWQLPSLWAPWCCQLHRGHRAGWWGSSKPWVCSHTWIHLRAAEEATWLHKRSIKLLLQTRKWMARAHSPRFVLLKLLAGQTTQEDLSPPSEIWLGWLPLPHLSTLFPSPVSPRTVCREDENIPSRTQQHAVSQPGGKRRGHLQLPSKSGGDGKCQPLPQD